MDFDVYLRFMLALVLVLGLIGGLTWAARRFGFGGQLTPNAGKSPRLSVVEVQCTMPICSASMCTPAISLPESASVTTPSMGWDGSAV